MSNKMQQLVTKLGDDSVPVEHRSSMAIDVLAKAQGGDPQCKEAAQMLFSRLQDASCDEVTKQRAKLLADIIKQLESVPLRPATFLQLAQVDEMSSVRHALVSLDNGDMAYLVASNQELAKKLRLGDRIMVDSGNKMMIHADAADICSGVEAKFERKIDARHLEVTNHQDEKIVVMAGPELSAKIDASEVKPGSFVVVGCGGRVALRALPPPEKHTDNYRFLDRGPVPDVRVERDIGSPNKIVFQVERHIREEMVRPELRRRFRLRPCITRLLGGVSGCGKTLHVQAMIRKMYEVMSEVTGTPIEQLPPRVFRFKNSQMLSMWLGESDKNFDRIFDEMERLAGVTYTNADGKEFKLPVLVVMEEADGVGRTRGQSNEAVYDRILTTVLQRLDPNRHGLSDQLVVFLSTTNEPHIVDPAFLRRIGGEVVMFGRLTQEAFNDVLAKHVDGLPAHRSHGSSQKKAWKSIVADIDNCLFVPGVMKPVIELSYQGHDSTVSKYHRDFLTGALVDRAVQQAATEAWEQSLIKDTQKNGITRDQLMRAIHHQVMGVVKQLCVENVSHYLDLPEGVRVTRVRDLTKSV